MVDVELLDRPRFVLVNLYAHNRDNPYFFSKIFESLEDFDVADTFYYKNLNKPNATRKVRAHISKLDLVDVWRTVKENNKQYTWFKKYPAIGIV